MKKTTKTTTRKKKREYIPKNTGIAEKDPHRNADGTFAKGNPGRLPGLSNTLRKSNKVDIWKALEKASKGLGMKECFDPLKELIKAIRDDKIDPADKGMLCARMLEFLYPKKKSVDVNFDPENMPAIVATVVPDGDASHFVGALLPPNAVTPAPGTPIMVNIGGGGNGVDIDSSKES